jgi:hypothetical protein
MQRWTDNVPHLPSSAWIRSGDPGSQLAAACMRSVRQPEVPAQVQAVQEL